MVSTQEGRAAGAALLAGMLLAGQACGGAQLPAGPPDFKATGSMGWPRASHAATLLAGGEVLVTGGTSGPGETLVEAERYDPVTGQFTLAHSLLGARNAHAAVLLEDGSVLVMGGQSPLALSSAERSSPATGEFAATGAMGEARLLHTATVLQGGKVLVVGGLSARGGAAGAEVYDPATGKFAPTGPPVVRRFGHTATRLGSGKVLVAGGISTAIGEVVVASAELYDPATGQFTATGDLGAARADHTATLLLDGTVLVAGGFDRVDRGVPLDTAERFDPATGRFTPVGSLPGARAGHQATLLPGGQVLVTGGAGVTVLASTALFDPTSRAFHAAGPLLAPRYLHQATLLPDGRVLVTGGATGVAGVYLPSAELYDPAVPAP